MNQTAYNRFFGFVSGRKQILALQKKKTENHARVICHLFLGTLALTSDLNFGMRFHIADVITRVKLCDSLLGGFRVLIPTILLFSMGLADRPYNSELYRATL